MKQHIIYILTMLSISPVHSQHQDSLQISLLTVSPRNTEIYTIYGHTALRLQNTETSTDIVFNWGTFDTSRKNFMYNFVRGETDYYLSSEPYIHFKRAYITSGAQIIEQTLNIPDSIKPLLVQEINKNLLPENIEYRYNYFFDNCTLRPRDIIEKYCGGILVYPEQDKKITLRDLVHECTSPYPWMKFGIDIVIGSGADSLISRRTSLFLPAKLSETLNNTYIQFPDGIRKPIITSVISSNNISSSAATETKASTSFLSNPLSVFTSLFFFYLIINLCSIKKKTIFRLPFALLFMTAGAGGIIVAFLMLFSTHPCVSSNWNIIWLNPLYLIGFASTITKKRYKVFTLYHSINFYLLTVFLLFLQWIPQHIDIACLPLVLCLWIAEFTIYLTNIKRVSQP
ncbi:MAG: DUF4105 domain-containing protein [Dysgonamonadaceae bacterium]|nr:DUF4105 domain-containing protein [Dysgonamonadaceae bacterium]